MDNQKMLKWMNKNLSSWPKKPNNGIQLPDPWMWAEIKTSFNENFKILIYAANTETGECLVETEFHDYRYEHCFESCGLTFNELIHDLKCE